ncbi:hypothetical protein [Aliivibrio fischeri]|uniref:hypothetical protein n=1 Tax=Aliivibrio fischeri TaxID=668 RepID=UPI000AD95DEE|nr:hypothetical protein [Aliivibrio fischeri]
MIQNIISFMGAWSEVQSNYSEEFESLERGLNRYLSGNVILHEEGNKISPRALWEKALYDEGWSINEQVLYASNGRKLPIRNLGAQNNGLSAQIALNNPEFLTRWLFTYATLGVRHGLANIPILVVPMRDSLDENEQRRVFARMGTFEYYQEQLEMLSPLSLGVPFLIVGYSIHGSLLEKHVEELLPEQQHSSKEQNTVINQSIEFPPEYHQAGVGILNFFSTYLNENYPEQDATVRIEQKGLKVRMVVQSEDGNSEVIEKALHEYQKIMSGQESASKFTNNDKLILDLRNEVRAAKFRIESQQDFITFQNEKLRTSEEQVSTLLNLVGQGLKKDTHNINVQVNPCIQNNLSVTVNADISSSIGCLEELRDLLPKGDETSLPITDLSSSLQNIEAEQNPDAVRSSSSMSKFTRFIDKLSDSSSSIRKAVDSVQQGYEIASDLVEKYNKIAVWCGLPCFPSFK